MSAPGREFTPEDKENALRDFHQWYAKNVLAEIKHFNRHIPESALPEERALRGKSLSLDKQVTEYQHLLEIQELDLSGFRFLRNVDGLRNLLNLNRLILNECKALWNIDGLLNLINLTSLKLGNCDSLHNVDELKNLINLVSLDLSSCKSLLNVDGLVHLENLTSLNLSECKSIQDIFGLEYLINLSRLDLSGCLSLRDVNGLADLINLTHLDLGGCGSLQNVDGLKNLTNLISLDLGECDSLQNVDGLKNLTHLTVLELRGCKSIKNLDILQNLTDLISLNLSNCKFLLNVNGLERMTKLSSLKLNYCETLEDFDGLKELKNLTRLELSNIESLRNVNVIMNLVNLTSLSIICCSSLRNIDGLKNLTNLSTLDLRGCKTLQNVYGLKDLTNLTSLDLSYCESLHNIDVLKKLNNLTDLNLSKCEFLKNVDGFKNLSKLLRLDLNHCISLTNVDGLQYLTNLTKLEMRDCPRIKDIAPLISCSNLTELNLSGCPNIRDLSVLTQIPSLSKLEYDINPSLALYVLVQNTMQRNDVNWYNKNEDGYSSDRLRSIIDALETMPNLEPLASTFLDALYHFSAHKDSILYTDENLLEITKKLFSRDDLTEEALQKYFTVFFHILGCDGMKPLLYLINIDFTGKTVIIIKPLIAVLSTLKEEEEKQWAKDYVAELLIPYEKDREKIQEIAPTVSLFYANMDMPEKVNEWLEKATTADEPVWRDRVLVALVGWRTSRGETKVAKDLIYSIKTITEKDNAIASYLRLSNNDEDFALLFDEITDDGKKIVFAEELISSDGLTDNPKIINSLLTAVGDDPEKLTTILTKLIEKHPESELISLVASQFQPAGNQHEIEGIVKQFLALPIVRDNVLGLKKLASFEKEITLDNDFLKHALYEVLAGQLRKNNLLDDEGYKEIQNFLNGQKAK